MTKQPNPTKFRQAVSWLGGKLALTKKSDKIQKFIPNYRPGDVVTSLDGRSKYIVHTTGALLKLPQ